MIPIDPQCDKRRCQKTPQLGRVFSTHTALEKTGIELTESPRDKEFFRCAVEPANGIMTATPGSKSLRHLIISSIF